MISKFKDPMLYRPISATFRQRASSIKQSTFHCAIDPSCIAYALFFLLVTFMLSPRGPHHGIGVDLPKTANASSLPAALRDDSLRVFVMRDGSIYVRGSKTSLDSVAPKLREGLRNGSEKRVYLMADVRARYRTVKLVLDEVRVAGIQSVCFFADRPDDYASHATIHK